MGLISSVIKFIFGQRQQQANGKVPVSNGYLSRWEKERQARIAAAEAQLKPWIGEVLKEEGELSFSWESGNDEAFVTFQNSDEARADNFEDLEFYIIDKLDIPDAGEFQMNGSGTVFLAGNSVKVKYSSIMKEVVDFNEETEEEIYGEQIVDGDEIVLFVL
ncbi:hypothetical protein [Flavihumibacter petaseus]|uniref:Uncharacterized protein n=1 Tax=Flavihumibacter petaseus NBRC 106054 TaxID=1220578 RepID=A0A0E9MZX4_9BACT|nr:hypothetical protein [Flavihumibacter petaseus]GAO43119.1 hypothetical protein FPE01S_02_02230 [Flavihumibacter petaseus NBRC 106054]